MDAIFFLSVSPVFPEAELFLGDSPIDCNSSPKFFPKTTDLGQVTGLSEWHREYMAQGAHPVWPRIGSEQNNVAPWAGQPGTERSGPAGNIPACQVAILK